jgi:hypothetical protein
VNLAAQAEKRSNQLSGGRCSGWRLPGRCYQPSAAPDDPGNLDSVTAAEIAIIAYQRDGSTVALITHKRTSQPRPIGASGCAMAGRRLGDVK